MRQRLGQGAALPFRDLGDGSRGGAERRQAVRQGENPRLVDRPRLAYG
jgi:hypothetical protein